MKNGVPDRTTKQTRGLHLSKFRDEGNRIPVTGENTSVLKILTLIVKKKKQERYN